MPYSAEEIIEPFYAESQAQSNGRDPLAIQNSSVVIYTKMVPGITNVTNHLRYNGFYCWLLGLILEKTERKNSLVEQIRYLRRGELLLAYIMVNNYPSVTGVSGSAYPKNHDDEIIKLAKGADLGTKTENSSKLYWQLSTGAFGQYFIGVLKDLGLINHPGQTLNIFSLTADGNKLAIAFAGSIPTKQVILFWESVQNGVLEKRELQKLKSFSLVDILVGSSEAVFYKTLLLGRDDRSITQTFHRRNTIKLLLEFLDLHKNAVKELPHDFLCFNYSQNKKSHDLSMSTDTGWYLYEINELLHVAFEHFHGCFINVVEYYPAPISDILDNLVEETNRAWRNEAIDPEKTMISQLIGRLQKDSSEVYDHYNMMGQYFRTKEWGDCLVQAVKTLLCVYIDCETQIDQLKTYSWMKEHNFNRQGYAIELLEDLVQSKKDLTLPDYTKQILQVGINQHSFSSYRKSKIGQGLVHNYLIEDNLVRLLRKTPPSRTSSRLQNVTQYLLDIGWIERKETILNITDHGKKILADLCNQE